MNTLNMYPDRKFVLVILACIFYIACGKDMNPPIQEWPYWGYTTAARNEEPWSSEIFARHALNADNQLIIAMDSLLGTNIETQFEHLTFTYVKKANGYYPLISDASLAGDSLARVMLTILDVDVIIGSYKVIENDPESYLEIESIDTVTNIIKGRFGATMVVTKRPFPFYPDTIRYRNGRFETKIIE